jgi:hydrophobe/amphiphile efflux-3 (HAE3) family protein
MDRVSLAVARAIRHWPVQVVALAMITAFVLSWGLPRLEFQTGQDTLLDPASKLAQDNQRFQRQFGSDPMLVLFETPVCGAERLECERARITQLFTLENQRELRRLESDLDATGDYQSVISPLAILQFAETQIQQRMISQPAKLAADQQTAMDTARAAAAARGGTPEQQEAAAIAAREAVDAAFQEQFGADAARFLAISERSLENPAFVEFVMYGTDGNLRPDIRGIFPDDHTALMVVRPNGNLSIDEGAEVSAFVAETMDGYAFEGVSPLVSGPPLLIKEINDGMKRAMGVMAVLAVVIMVVVLFVVFRARWRLLSLPAVLVGCVAGFGLMGFLGIPLTMVTISGLPILIGLGVDFAIQAHSRIEEETFAMDSADGGLDRTFSQLGPALAIAAVAACIGFAVLHFSDVPMIRDFGTMLAVGSLMVFAWSIALISGVVYLRERKRLDSSAQAKARIEVERIVGGLTSATVGRLLPIALVAVVVAGTGLWMSRRIPTETDPERFVPSDSAVLQDLDHVRGVVGSTSELSLLIETSGGKRVTDQEVLAWLYEFETRQLARYQSLQRSNSIATLTARVSGEPPTTEAAAATLASAPDALVVSVLNEDATMASVVYQIGDGASLAERETLTDSILADAKPPEGVAVAPAGIAVVGAATVDALSSNRDLMSLVAIGAIFAALLLAYRSPVKAILPLLPVVLALGASAMIFYISGISYSPLTSISGPLIIAMGTEFNILLMSRYYEERATGLAPRAAMSRASMRIGRAIAASGLTVMGGFAVLAFSNFPLLDNFGIVTTVNVGVSLLSTLILLPPLLVWADETQHRGRTFAGVERTAAP